MLHLEQKSVQRLEQRQMLTQQQIQGLALLQLNALELEQHLSEVLEQNPFLEMVPVQEAVSPPVSSLQDDTNSPEFADRWAEAVFRRHEEGSDLSFNPDRGEVWQYRIDSIQGEESLHSHLMRQLRAAVKTQIEESIGSFLIQQFDQNGFFTGSIGEMAGELGVPPDEVTRILELIKTFEPTGVGAANLQECLLLQIEAEHSNDNRLRTLVRDHFGLLMERRIPAIAKAMGITEVEVEAVMGRLRALEPRPGRAFSSGPSMYVVPEVIIQEVPEERRTPKSPRYEAVLADRMFRLRLDGQALADYRQTAMDGESRSWVRGKTQEAAAMLNNITRREQTLLAVAQCIADTQADFLEKGEACLRPLRMLDVANRIGAHESTVSRTVNGKYVQTPQGVLEMRKFFSVGLASEDGEDQSARAVQAHIRRLIESESKASPLSDEALSEMLNRSEGIKIARRTVAKYRELMGIPTKSQRRRFS